jgi:YD repeat-containing protein
MGAPRYHAHPSNLIGYENVAGTGVSKVNRVNTTKYGAMEKIDSWSQTVEFYSDWVDDPVENLKYVENYPTTVLQKAGNTEVGYYYDDRGNVTERAIIGEGVSVTADYPSRCHGGNFRYCNKPEWIEDARGNRTHYEYHAPSGQISRKVAPDDANLRNPTTEYEYDQYYAHYKIDSDTIEQAETPVWLLTKETHCQNSSMYSDGTCVGDDDVVTEYEYDHYNLFLIGVAVTAKNSQGVLETRRTCYEYDVYGNKIGETNPRANKASCQ